MMLADVLRWLKGWRRLWDGWLFAWSLDRYEDRCMDGWMNGDHTSVDDDDDFICRFKCVYSTQILFYGKPTVCTMCYMENLNYFDFCGCFMSPHSSVCLPIRLLVCCLSDAVCLVICGGSFYDYDLISLIMGRSRIVKARAQHNKPTISSISCYRLSQVYI